MREPGIAPVSGQPSETEVGQGSGRQESPVDHLEIAEVSFRTAVVDAFSYAPAGEVAVRLSDLHSHLVQACAASVRMLAEVAKGHRIPPDQFQDMLAVGQGSGYAENSVRRLQRENAQLRRELKNVEQLQATIEERDLVLRTLENDLKGYEEDKKEMEARLENIKKEMEDRVATSEKRCQKEKKLRAKMEQELKEKVEALEKDNKAFKDFLEEEVPGLKGEGFRVCQDIYLKKIFGRYPDADMRYFADAKAVPEGIEISEDWFPASPTPGSVAQDAGDVAQTAVTEVVLSDADAVAADRGAEEVDAAVGGAVPAHAEHVEDPSNADVNIVD